MLTIPPAPRCLPPHPGRYVPTDGDWQLQDLPGAPGTARQGRTRTIVSTNDGGKATQPRAPGHGRPPAAQRAARHGRLSADSGAPGADVPLASTAGAPGQHCLSAALQAPDDDAPLAATAMLPSHHRPSAAFIATAPVPAGVSRLHQGFLPRVPANPRTLTYPHSRPTASSLRRKPRSSPQPAAGHRTDSPSLPGKGTGDRSRPHHTWHYPCGFGLSAVRSKSLPIEKPTLMSRLSPADNTGTTHQVHPAIQAPTHPRSCSTADAGFPLQRHPRAPPVPCPSCPRTRESRHAPANPVGVSLVGAVVSYPPFSFPAREGARG